ncbi:adenylate/guanylate cyclase domain-containing protein [Variovorax sp. JS1663]|uniref:adenylate/guanylate cyclase domain-containing protein n=1 Tax=Variovorax sp. JS1663 TaxID=1851577 RepID=UPI000B6AD29C|nr:adenylate/guanylate cyclase domain-containing protein [Variovorax sp. JS1663]OUM00329.1 hypothetical protein A8M77_21860 [Variovorax sp. JS1663]
MLICSHCQASNPEGGRFCQSCGIALELPCTACGAANPVSARFCGQCGASLAPASAPPAPSSGVPLAQQCERKHVTVLFADIRGSTELIEALDPEAAMGQLDPALDAMAAAVTRFGGMVNSVRGDGIMALFGVPVACEDHAVRACLAAGAMLEAQRLANDPKVQIRVGLDSGEVVIRPTGSDAYDYDAAGVIAHLANRAEQQAAPGTALMTGRTARLARGHVAVASLGRRPIKGLSEPLELFQLQSAVARPAWEARCSAHALSGFVGRSNEFAQLRAAMDRAALGSGQVVVVAADAGFGKSRLVHEFLREQRSGSWNVLRVAALSHAAGAPYSLAAELLRSLLGVDVADERVEVARKLDHTLALIDPEHRTDLAPLQSLLDLPLRDEAWLALAPPQRRSRSIAALRTVVLREAALRPLILLVEDYHWADLPSAEVLDAVVEGMGAARLLLLVTTRPDRYPPWTRRRYCLQLQLPALEPENAAVLLDDLIDASAQLAPLRRQILERAGGVPLFLEELARSLADGGMASAATAGGDGFVVPASVQAVIAARIDRLRPSARRLLHTASVIGKDVPFHLLEAVAGLPRPELEAEIAELQSLEFLYELDLAAGREYTFRHVLIQTAAYEEMLRKTRRDMHARVMQAMEQLFAGRLDEWTERLADHALRGEAWRAAVAYALKAGDRATGRWAWREAIGFYERAIEAITHLPQDAEAIRTAIEARLRLRVALPGVADLPRIARCLDEAKALALSAGMPQRLAEIDTSQCLTLTKMGLLQPAIDAGRHGYAQARELGDKAAFLNASFALAQAFWYHGEFGQAEALLTDRLHEMLGELRLRNTGTTGTASVLSLVCLSKTRAITGQAERARATIAHARRIAQDMNKPFDICYSGVGLGFCQLLEGDAAGAAATLEESLRLARSADIALLIPSSQRYLGRAYALSGRLEEARVLLDDAIARTGSSGLLGMQLWSLAALGQLQLLGPSPRDAAQTLDDTLALARRHGFRPLVAHLLRLLGRMQALEGHGGEASYRDAIALADSMGMAPEAEEARRELQALRVHHGTRAAT